MQYNKEVPGLMENADLLRFERYASCPIADTWLGKNLTKQGTGKQQ